LALQLQQEPVSILAISWNSYYFIRHQVKKDKPDAALIHRFLNKVYCSILPEGVLVDKLILLQLIRLPESVWALGALSPYLKKAGLIPIIGGRKLRAWSDSWKVDPLAC
jgi:hypothetical protein